MGKKERKKERKKEKRKKERRRKKEKKKKLSAMPLFVQLGLIKTYSVLHCFT